MEKKYIKSIDNLIYKIRQYNHGFNIDLLKLFPKVRALLSVTAVPETKMRYFLKTGMAVNIGVTYGLQLCDISVTYH
jgi:glutaredoxin 2